VICGGDAQAAEYILSWMARAVQAPVLRGEVALVFRGKEGVGKGTVGRSAVFSDSTACRLLMPPILSVGSTLTCATASSCSRTKHSLPAQTE